MSPNAPEPHPLDFDWRFTRETAHGLADRVNGSSILAVGTPLVVQSLEQGLGVRLVDRQPHLSVNDSLNLDVEVANPIEGSWETAVLDPPWYPLTYERWLGWAAQHIYIGGTILASVWPTDTRPTAEAERRALLAWISEWADHEIAPASLRYEVPLFEAVARGLQNIPNPGSPWRMGDLLELRVRRRPLLPPPLVKMEVWRRFVWSDYQLALRIAGEGMSEPTLARHPLASGWIWPSYSLRAEGRERIGLWSSRNEVAIVSGARRLDEELAAFTVGGLLSKPFSDTFMQLLSSWQVPDRPFSRSYLWTHHV